MQRIIPTYALLLASLHCQPSIVAADRSLADVRSAIVSVRWNVGAPQPADINFNFTPPEGVTIQRSQITGNVIVEDISPEKNLQVQVVAGNALQPLTNDRGVLFLLNGLTSKQTTRATGFVIGQRIVSMTNSEARKSDSLVVINADGSEYKPTILAWDSATGLTVFEVKSDIAGEPTTGLNFAEKSIEWGDSVRVAHEWRTGNPALITGIVSTTPEYDGAVRAATFDIDGQFTENTNGAPVLNAANEVVGIVNGQRSSSGDAGPGIAIQVDKIRSLIAFVDAGSKGALPKPMLGVALSLTAKGAEIEKVIENSPASSAGLKTGDLIVSIEGQKATRPEHIIALVDQRMPGDEIKVQIERDGAMQELTLQLAALQTPDEASTQTFSKTVVWNTNSSNAIANLPPGIPAEQRKQIEETLAKLQADANIPKAAAANSESNEGGTKRVYISAIPPDVSQQVAELRKDIAEIKELLKSLKKE